MCLFSFAQPRVRIHGRDILFCTGAFSYGINGRTTLTVVSRQTINSITNGKNERQTTKGLCRTDVLMLFDVVGEVGISITSLMIVAQWGRRGVVGCNDIAFRSYDLRPARTDVGDARGLAGLHEAGEAVED